MVRWRRTGQGRAHRLQREFHHYFSDDVLLAVVLKNEMRDAHPVDDPNREPDARGARRLTNDVSEHGEHAACLGRVPQRTGPAPLRRQKRWPPTTTDYTRSETCASSCSVRSVLVDWTFRRTCSGEVAPMSTEATA